MTPIPKVEEDCMNVNENKKSRGIIDSLKIHSKEMKALNPNQEAIEKESYKVTFPKSFTNNLKDQKSLDKTISKINQIQQEFRKGGFIEKDQENWINFEAYANQKERNLIGLIRDIGIQHNWLADNVTQLVADVQDGLFTSGHREET